MTLKLQIESIISTLNIFLRYNIPNEAILSETKI